MKLHFQISGALFTIMRLLGRVEAGKDLKAVSICLAILAGQLLYFSPYFKHSFVVKVVDAKSGHSCHMNATYIWLCHGKAGNNDSSSCIPL